MLKDASAGGVNDGFEAVVSSQLLMHVMDVIPQGARRDPQHSCNFRSSFPLGEQTQDTLFLFGQGQCRCVRNGRGGQRRKD